MAAAKFRLQCTDYNGCEGHLMGFVPLFFYLNYFIWGLKTLTRREASSSLERSCDESGPENFGVDEVTKSQELPPLFQLKPGKEQLFRLLVESLLRIIMGALWEGNDNHFEKAQTYWEGLINTKKESLVANSRWRDYKEKLKKCKVVNFRFLKLTMEHQQCEACLMPRFLTECVVCDEEKFKVCQSCSARGSVYHDLHHYKQPLEEKCTEQLKKVQEMAGTEKPEGIIKKCLDDEGWLDGLFSHFQSTLNAANEWAID